MWKNDAHRLDRPLRHLRYDPGVGTHVDALLALVRRWLAAAATRPAALASDRS